MLATRTATEELRLHRDRIALTAFFLLVSLSPLSAHAGNMDGTIDREYPSRLVTLRHFYSGDYLHFRSDGTVVGDATVGPWTVDGEVEVRDASLDGGVLTIKGRRIYQLYNSDLGRFVDALTTIGNFSGKQQKDVEKMLRKRQVEIQIDMPPTPDPREIPETLHIMFLAPGESMTAVVASYWHDYFDKLEGKPAKSMPPPGVVVFKPGVVSAPHATFRPDPEYSEDARKLKHQGTLVISLVVDSTGITRDLQIVRPVGLGLDEKGIAAVSQWKFQPAEKDGRPVAIAISVEVDFHLY